MGLVIRIYNLMPVQMQSALLSMYGFYLQWLRYGATFQSQLSILKNLERASSSDQSLYQKRRLNEFVRNAVNDVPYYRERYSSRLPSYEINCSKKLSEIFPILKKEIVRAQVGNFYSDSNLGPCTTINTSGSSGSPLNVRASRWAVSENYAFFERFLNAHGVSYRDKSATFAGRMIIPAGQQKPPYWRFNAAQNTWLLSSYHLAPKNFDAYIEALSKIQPKFIDAYPSAIVSLARHINGNSIRHDIAPKVIVTSSETLTDSARQEITRAFGCPVADQYGNAEMAGFIAQCEHGRYHAHTEYGVMELVDEHGAPVEPGQVGQLIFTGLVNPAMPLIRYAIGDSAILDDQPCPCGRHYPVIKEILGRTDDLIITPDGRQIGRLDPLFKGVDGVEEAQIVQLSIEHIEIRVVFKAGLKEKQRCAQALTEAMLRRLDADVNVQVREVVGIEKGANGKFKAVVSLLKNKGKEA